MSLSCSLLRHNRQYHVNCSEVIKGIIISPYAMRHLEQAKADGLSQCGRLRHRIIAVIEFIPVLGAIVSIIERLVVLIFQMLFGSTINQRPVPPLSPIKPGNQSTIEKPNEIDLNAGNASAVGNSAAVNPSPRATVSSSLPVTAPAVNVIASGVLNINAQSISSLTIAIPAPVVQPVSPPLPTAQEIIAKWHADSRGTRRFAPERANQKMLRNFNKALIEKRRLPGTDNAELIPGPGTIDLPSRRTVPRDLQFKVSECERQGVRKDMEDAHFHTQMEQGLLAGIFDGHGDLGKMAQYVAKRFKEGFGEVLKAAAHPHEAFEAMIHQIQSEIGNLPGGCTGLICFVDKKTHRVYTATLGDTEAKIYREIGGEMRSIPLSCVRDWHSEKDYERAKKWYRENNMRGIGDQFDREQGKHRRFPGGQFGGVNVSRGFGDELIEAVSHKAKITVHYLKPDDLLVLGCDGVWDFSGEKGLINNVIRPNIANPSVNLAERIVNYALTDCQSQDNVTAMAIRVS